VKIAAKITMARMKFANGPAATMAARLPHRLMVEALAPLAGVIDATAA
jgi:hypothetical protein